MAGFLTIVGRSQRLALVLALLAVAPAAGLAQMTNMAPAAPTPATAPVPPAQAAAKPPIIPPVPVDYFQRYGKILSAGNEPSHPLKLAMPNPDFGQVKIPTPDELAMREKLERLTTMSDEDIRRDLGNWPAFKKMSLADEGLMMMRIEGFKNLRSKIAQERARALGLLTLKPDQLDKFTNEYWEKRLQMDRDLTKQFSAAYKAADDKMEEQLYREYSTPDKPVPPPTKAAAPAPVLAPTAPKPPQSPAQPMQAQAH